jgi:hypothetical protein
MSPLVLLVGRLVREVPWAIVGSCGALVGALAVRGARSAAVPPDVAGPPDGDDESGPPGPARVVTVQPHELTVGVVAGPLLALVLRPRPVGAFLGGLAAGAAAAALIPGQGPSSPGAGGDAWRMPR